jgi:hypothetical protein
MTRPLFALVIILCSFCSLQAQKIAELKVPLSASVPGIEIPLSINLDEITLLPDSTIALVEVSKGKRTAVPFQIENKGTRLLHWMVQPDGSKQKIYELVKQKPQAFDAQVAISRSEGTLFIQSGDKKLLGYTYKTMYPPAGIDTAFKRSGFIHPLNTPHGQSLTRIQAPDHYHHYGLWNPWTHVLFEGQQVDFWNLKDRKGTVRFANFVSTNGGPVFGDYQVVHDHVAFKKDGSEKVAMNELQSVRIYQPANSQDYYIMDITIQLNCASNSPVVLEEYRYGGLGWRATEKWNDNNSEIVTSEGKTRKNADGSKARWCIVQGSLDADYGGAVMMSYPTNYNYPEPLRIWPEKMNGRGDVYANFSPTKDRDWPLKPGNDYVLKYRFLVFNGKYTKEKAEAAWNNFANPPKVVVKTTK